MKQFVILFLLGLGSTLTSCAQSSSTQGSGFVPDNGISSPVHQANIGKIRFSTTLFPKDGYKDSDFLASFDIEEDSDFNFIAFFANSLTNSLHRLAPDLTADELVQKGNFQFSFYVDGELLYTENLNPGAGLPHQKHEQTLLRRPFLSRENLDSWGRFLWNRFYSRSGFDEMLETGTHLLKIEIRPYLKKNGLLVGEVMAQGEIKLRRAKPKAVSKAQIAIQPIQPNSGWEVASTRYNQKKIRALNEKIAQNRFKHITSVVVVKEGKLLIEEYFNGANRSTLHNTRSVGKSFASTLIGIAIEEGYLEDTEQSLGDLYDLRQYENYSPQKEQVTLKSLLTMSSGFDGSDADSDSPGFDENMYNSDDWAAFTLNLPMDETKEIGETWDYFTAGAVLLGDIVNKSVPRGLETYADEKLFQPLGISHYEWSYTPQKIAHTAGGLQMNALDFAKYGQLYKNGGIWKGQEILPSDWVSKTMTNYFKESPDQTPYGFLFWNHTFTANKKSYEAFLCSGMGGNKVIVFTDQPLVIVVTATAYGAPYSHTQVVQMIETYILPAVL